MGKTQFEELVMACFREETRIDRSKIEKVKYLEGLSVLVTLKSGTIMMYQPFNREVLEESARRKTIRHMTVVKSYGVPVPSYSDIVDEELILEEYESMLKIKLEELIKKRLGCEMVYDLSKATLR